MTLIHLEYEGGYYPYSYADESGRLRGIFMEFWNIVAEAKGLEMNITRLVNKKQLLDNVESNKTFTMIDSFAMSSSRFDKLLESPSFGYYELNFYEVARSADEQTSPLSFFTVFQWSTLLLLIAAYIITSVLEFLLNRRKPTLAILSISRQLISVIFILSLTIVVFHHSAGFKGDAFVVSTSKPTALEDLLVDVKSGKRSIITEVKDLLPPTVQAELTANRPDAVQFIPENSQALARLCDDHTMAIMTNKNNLLELGEVRPGCELIPMTVSQDTVALWNSYNINVYTFGQLVPSYYLYSLIADRKLIRFVSQVLLKMFDQDRFEGFWTMRHLRSLRNLPITDTPVMDYSPMTLLRLSIIFYIFLGFIVLSLLVFVGELLSCCTVLFAVATRTIRGR